MPKTLHSLCILGSALAGYAHAGHMSSKVDDIFDKLTLEGGLGQLFQLEAASTILNGSSLKEDDLSKYATLGIGSYLNNIGIYDKNGTQENLNGSEIRAVIDRIMNVSLEKQPYNPILYGLDSVHGANFVGKATIFPAQINIGATFDVKYAFQVEAIASDDTAGAGGKLIFGPVVDIPNNMKGPRVQETYGEDTFLVSQMATQAVKGIQNSGLVAACPKHFLAYQATSIGYDRTNVEISQFNLVNKILKPYMAATDAGALCIMESFSTLNTLPMVDNTYWLSYVLRDVLAFKGFVITDYKEVQNLVDYHHTAENYSEALKRSIRAGVDITMTIDYYSDWIGMLKDIMKEDPSMIPFVTTAIKRVIYVKSKLDLYKNPYSGKDLISKIGSQESIDMAVQVARDSIVLMRNNNNTLPLEKDMKVFLSGNAFDSAGGQSGGWSRSWQGQDGNDFFKERITILDAMKKYAQKLTYTMGLNISEEYNEQEVSKAKKMAMDADICVVALGEHSGVEKPYDIDDLAIPVNQTKYLNVMKAACKQLVLVLVQARPRTFDDSSEIGAILNTALVGPFGGQAIAEILLGMYNPNGRQVLSYSMKDGYNGIHYDSPVDTKCGNGECITEYPFGHGLSYSNFSYSNFKLSAENVSCTGKLTVTVDVTNNGPMDGKEAVLLFIQQKTRSHVPEKKTLQAFQKITVRNGESMTVTFDLNQKAWTHLSPNIEDNFRRVCEPGQFFVAMKYDTQCNFNGPEKGPMCGAFRIV
uniref:beta-glucosidase n=1 Tax=Albugo laibachii Nc14 TaxID=890382 RepID=F0WJD0_9STRA|nr:unnamed protein product [Albugo laibachii Nc14]|eukprot:CCA21377.1 unnamed protein product [Albugo laibachii Nc14]